MAVVDGQQNQDVHKQSSPLDLPKRGQVYFGRFYQAKRSNKIAGCKTSVPVSIRRIYSYQLSNS